MNQIERALAEEQIGPEAFAKLARLTAHLGDSFNKTTRISQSIITRSEVELFGLSVPRFAIRLYLLNGGFLNCRRLATLVQMLEGDGTTELGRRYDDTEISPSARNGDLAEAQEPHIPIREVMVGQNCIADSLIPQPTRLARFKVRYLDISLARLPESYGEPRSQDDDLCGMLPYTQSMNLGGGLCAQAVSFMATAILANHSKAVHGIAEITALAHPPGCRELALGSLDTQGMGRYFDKVNLHLTEQCLSKKPCESHHRGRVHALASAIRCYLNSGMPVIFPTNSRKLAQHPSRLESIYCKNGLFIPAETLPKDDDHVVIIVGHAKKDEDELFIFHDSATVPFLAATISQLAMVGTTRIAPDEVTDNGVIMPVVPKPVGMPLLDERVYETPTSQNNQMHIAGFRFGLDLISQLFHFVCAAECGAQPNLFPDRFQLIRSDTPNISLRQVEGQRSRTVLECGLLHALSGLEETLAWHKPHWLWTESFANSIWIWDAEIKAPAFLPEDPHGLMELLYSGYLLAVVYVEVDGDTSYVRYYTDFASSNSHAIPSAE